MYQSNDIPFKNLHIVVFEWPTTKHEERNLPTEAGRSRRRKRSWRQGGPEGGGEGGSGRTCGRWRALLAHGRTARPRRQRLDPRVRAGALESSAVTEELSRAHLLHRNDRTHPRGPGDCYFDRLASRGRRRRPPGCWFPEMFM